jgi:hypothetical protein
MKKFSKAILCMIPLLASIVGYAFAYAYHYGLLETWQFVGRPDENIVQIIGIQEGGKLFVSTETGTHYSLETGQLYPYGLHYHGAVVLPPKISWEKEQLEPVDLVSPRPPWYPNFVNISPFFRVKQIYELEYVYRTEGKGEVRYALTEDGNLWMWNHEITGLSGLILYFYPFLGFVVGLTVVLGACGYLRAQMQGRRTLALLVGLTAAMAIMGLGKYFLVQLQGAARSRRPIQFKAAGHTAKDRIQTPCAVRSA